MFDWKRVTREVFFDDLPQAMVEAIIGHIELYNLGSILEDSLMCIQTDSKKIKKGLFGKEENVSQGAVITPRWLIWAVTSRNKPAVLSAQLLNVTVQDYALTQFSKMVPDSGIEVSGVFTDASESASAFIGLDDGTAAKKFKETVIKAAQDAKK